MSWRGVKCVFHFIQFNSNGIVTVSCTSESETANSQLKQSKKQQMQKCALVAASIELTDF